MMITGTAH